MMFDSRYVRTYTYLRTERVSARLVAWARILAHWRSGASTPAHSERATDQNWPVVW
jgi:hypothetical protein